MAHLQYMPGDPRLVDQLVYELKSKGIFDQFRKDCIADVDTRPAYQNLRQRVENSVSTFLSRQCWKPDLNKNQLREKLRKHILDGNYLEQGVERIVDQVVNPKVASVFIPQVEDLVYNYLGVPRKKANNPETSNGKVATEDLLPTDLEAVSPGSVKSNDDKNEAMDHDISEDTKMDVDDSKEVLKEEEKKTEETDQYKEANSPSSTSNSCVVILNELSIPTPSESINIENIPPPDNSPPKVDKVDLEKIELPKEPYVHPNLGTSDVGPNDIPLPKDDYFKPHQLNSEDDSSSDSSLRRNMSPLTPIRNYNNENSCDAQQAFENDSDGKTNDNKEPSSFRFAIGAKSPCSDEKEKKDDEQINLSSQFNNQVNINTFATPLYDDSSNSNNLQIDYESDANSKATTEKLQDIDQESEDKKDKKSDDKKSSHKSSHRSRDSHGHSSSKDKRAESKHSTSRDSSRHDKKLKDDHNKSKSSHRERERSKDRSEKKDSRDSSRHKSSHKSSSHRDSKSHRSSSSSQKPSSDKKSDDKRSTSSRDKDRNSSRSSKDKKDSRSSYHRSEKDKKSSSSKKHEDKDKKKDKKDTDDHYSLSGRGNHSRRSTDRDSNDGSSSSKGSQNQPSSRITENKKEGKASSTKSSNTSSESSPSDSKEVVISNTSNAINSRNQQKPIRVENHLETPITSPPRLPFVPDITLKKPKFAANLEEAKRMMKMRRFLDEEQKRMNQEAALLLEFQANVRPSLSQVYSSIPGPELEFACIPGVVNRVTNTVEPKENKVPIETSTVKQIEDVTQNEINTHTKIGDDEKHTYNENKPFSQLMEEITEYSKASEKKRDAVDKDEEENTVIEEDLPNNTVNNVNNELNLKNTLKLEINTDMVIEKEEILQNKPILGEELSSKHYIHFEEQHELKKDDIVKQTSTKADVENVTTIDNKTVPNEINRSTYIEVTIITEELSETEGTSYESEKFDIPNNYETENTKHVLENTKSHSENTIHISKNAEDSNDTNSGESLRYFSEQEKFDAEIKRHQYANFLKTYIENNTITNKIYVINCDTYEADILKEVSKTFGHFEIVNYYKNGHLKLPKVSVNVVKDVNLSSEINLPIDIDDYSSKSNTPVFSPVKSESSFELTSDYDAKLEEMVNKTSRKQVMEIIFGNIVGSENLTIDYCTDSLDSDFNFKRKYDPVENAENNNKQVTKMRKLSDSDEISSTTEETVEVSNINKTSNPQRSKYLGRARRVGLPRPRKTNLPNSPSSDKSVENYEQNTPTTPNGKLKVTPRTKIQRYEKSDLYKPKLHYLSRRNNIS